MISRGSERQSRAAFETMQAGISALFSFLLSLSVHGWAEQAAKRYWNAACCAPLSLSPLYNTFQHSALLINSCCLLMILVSCWVRAAGNMVIYGARSRTASRLNSPAAKEPLLHSIKSALTCSRAAFIVTSPQIERTDKELSRDTIFLRLIFLAHFFFAASNRFILSNCMV